jgi:hypothetical protein
MYEVQSQRFAHNIVITNKSSDNSPLAVSCTFVKYKCKDTCYSPAALRATDIKIYIHQAHSPSAIYDAIQNNVPLFLGIHQF